MAKRKAKRTTGRERPESRFLKRLCAVGAWFGVVSVAILGVWGSVHVRDRVKGDPRYSLAEWQLDLVELPAWVTPEIQTALETLVDLDSGAGSCELSKLTLFDRGVLRHLQTHLESSPWVERLVGVRLSYPSEARPGAVHVELDLRRPVALVEYRGLYYLTDREGRRLGAPYSYAPTEWFRIPRIRGGEASIHSVPESGERWDSIHVENGIWVATYLHDHGVLEEFAERPIEAIDVSNVGGRYRRTASEIVLIWEGRRLTWGQAPLSDVPRTVSLQSIIENLRQVLREPQVYGTYAEINLHRDVMTGKTSPAG